MGSAFGVELQRCTPGFVTVFWFGVVRRRDPPCPLPWPDGGPALAACGWIGRDWQSFSHWLAQLAEHWFSGCSRTTHLPYSSESVGEVIPLSQR
jgi:hypothetical protein